MAVANPMDPDRLALGRDPRVVLWRNNTGSALQDYGSAGLKPLRYGLALGSSDLIGLVKPSGRFVALEVKSARGAVSKEQAIFLALVESMGGIARVVRSVDEALRAVEDAQVARGVAIQVADAHGTQCERGWIPLGERTEYSDALRTSWWNIEPDVGRVAHGVTSRVDRLRALGNGQVPGVVRLAWRTLAAEVAHASPSAKTVGP